MKYTEKYFEEDWKKKNWGAYYIYCMNEFHEEIIIRIRGNIE